MAGKPTRALASSATVTLTWARRKGNRVPATHRAGVYGADHGCSCRLRKHRFLGRGARGRRVARPVRRRRQQQLHRRGGRRGAQSGVEPLGQGRAGRRGGHGVGALSGGQRPDPGRLLADGVGSRQQRPPTLVHPAVAGRRIVEPVVGRLRQPLHRSTRRHDVVPGDPMVPVAAAGDRNADHPKDSRAGPSSGGDASGSGAAVRRPPRHGDRHPAGSGGRRRPHRLPTRSGRLPAGTAALPGRRGTRVRRHGGHRGGAGVATRRARAGARRAEVQPRAEPRCCRRPGPATRSRPARWPARWPPPTARRSTSTAATTSCGPSTPPTASRSGRHRSVPAADPALGVAGGPDHRRRRSRTPSWSRSGTAATTPT